MSGWFSSSRGSGALSSWDLKGGSIALYGGLKDGLLAEFREVMPHIAVNKTRSGQ